MASGQRPASSPTLTSFAPHDLEARPQGGFFSRLFGKSEAAPKPARKDPFVVEHEEKSTDTSESNSVNEPSQEDREGTPDSDKSSDSANTNGSVNQARTLKSVLSRLGNILDRRSQTPQAYKDSDFKQYWMPDSNCKECYECGDKFNTFRRRHHCRICGQIFCSRCCNQEVPGKFMGYTGYLRVCCYCCKIVLSYAQHSEGSGDLDSLTEDLDKQLRDPDISGSNNSFDTLWTPTLKRKKQSRVSTIFDEDSSGQRRLSTGDLSSSPPNNLFTSNSTIRQERKALLQDSGQLRDIWLQIQAPGDGMVLQTYRHRLRTYTNALIGSDIVEWLISRNIVSTREQAVAIGQALVDAHWLECITAADQVFRDETVLYTPGEMALKELVGAPPAVDRLLEDESSTEPQWFRDIKPDNADEEDADSDDGFEKIPSTVSAPAHLEQQGGSGSIFYIPLRAEEAAPPRADPGQEAGTELLRHDRARQASLASLSSDKGANQVVSLESEAPTGWQGEGDLREENGERLAFDRLSKAHSEHIMNLTNQMLSRSGLSLKWTDTILSIAKRVSSLVRPDVKNERDDMDIRQYITVKKIPGGQRNNSNIVCGVVCSKNIAHKKMRSHISSPKILLLRAPIEYQRVENKFSSLEPQILQEYEFLKNCVGRIAALEPDILLVEKTVSRLAQEFLLEAGITLVINVKASVLERVARMTKADIVTSIDGLVSREAMGRCHTFTIQSYCLPEGETKTLMYFDGCDSHLGCTVTLRGGSMLELKKVKKILLFMSYVAYHLRLELSFLMDEFALPPAAPDESDVLMDEADNPQNDPDPAENQKLTSNSSSEINGAIDSAKKEDFSEPKASQSDFSIGCNPLERGHSAKEGIVAGQKEMKESPTRCRRPTPTKQQQQMALRMDSNNSESGKISIIVGESELDGGLVVPKAGGNESDKSAVTEKVENSSGDVKEKRNSKDALKKVVTSEILDFSDPLQNYQVSKDETIFESKVTFHQEESKSNRKFKKALQDVILNVSPFIRHEIPYLETEQGSTCKLRKFFQGELYVSEYFSGRQERKSIGKWNNDDGTPKKERKIAMQDPHPFVLCKMTVPVTDHTCQASLADFRARGGRLLPCNGQKASGNKRKTPERITDDKYDGTVDCLDPMNHQKLYVLFSSFSDISANAPNPCVNPWVVTMDFYGRNDMPLGTFLERYCFRSQYRCPSESCDTGMINHIRRFVHENGSLQILLQRVERAMPNINNTILMWSWCRKCKQVTPVVPMAHESWSMSFAKYLEMRFHGAAYTRRGSALPCTHPLHHDYYQYFGYEHIVASFKYSHIGLLEVALPPILVTMHSPKIVENVLLEEIKTLHFKGTGVYNAAWQYLHGKESDSQFESVSGGTELTNLLQIIKKEKDVFSQHLDGLTSLATSLQITDLDPRTRRNLNHEIHDQLIEIKILVAGAAITWNNRLTDIEQQQKRHGEKNRQNIIKTSKEVSGNSTEASSVASVAEVRAVRGGDEASSVDTAEPTFVSVGTGETAAASASQSALFKDESVPSSVNWTDSEPDLPSSLSVPSAIPESLSSSSSKGSSQGTPVLHGEELEAKDDAARSLDTKTQDVKPYQKQTSQTEKRHNKPDDVGEKKTMKTLLTNLLQSGAGTALIPNPFPPEEHYLLRPPYEKIPLVVIDREPSSIIAYTLSTQEYERQLEELVNQKDLDPLMRNKQGKENSGAESTPDETRKSKVLSFFRGEARDKSPSAAPRVPAPAATAASQQVAPPGGKVKLEIGAVKYTPKLDRDSVDVDEEDFAFFSGQNDMEKSTKSTKSRDGAKEPEVNYHIELQFADSNARFYCRVYYAEHFKNLRSLIFPDGEERFIRSLSRCFTWHARGGKSGSMFCKTQDDRFILKQMSRYEVQSFLEFAPHYVKYITKAHDEKKPTALAKILGVYRIGYKNSQTTMALKQDLLVMENLFYDRKINQIFDLKGSMRNRLVNTSGKRVEELVLLDENLLKLSVDHPLYIRPHSKTALTLAITNDTEFLSHHLIMDYSLLVGIDEKTKELVVGIIDYIRTFTWDKKLEMLVKSSSLLGQAKMPTVVSPEVYRVRFQEAMDKYFLFVPDRWTGLGRDVDC